ncbi:MAG: hypothetical protein DMF63_04365 [Acidobacteria bacterium]|nr:MAG: hypothetical protein DMF63_04365 [Acidobacteriota bacterium]
MKKLLLTFLSIGIIALVGGQAIAQQKVSPEKEALVKELLEVTGSTKSVTDVMDVMMGFQKVEFEKSISSMIADDKTMSAEEKAAMKQSALESMDRVTKRTVDFFTKEIDLSKALNEIAVPMYDRNFSETELRELIAFYRSTTGQKTISVMPKLMLEAMTGFSEKVLPKLQDFLKKTTDEEFAAIKQKVEQEMKAPRPKSKL